MEIVYLADHPELVGKLVALHFRQWGHLRPEESIEERTARLMAEAGRGGVPTVLIALEDGELVGSAMLVADDMRGIRHDLTPWLAGVYVVEERRGRDIGTALVTAVEAEAVAAGAERLYLYTPDAMPFYEKLGWTECHRRAYLGQEVVIMSKAPG